MGIAVDSRTGDVYVVDGGEEKVQVFIAETPAKPTVAGLAAQDITPSEVALSAQVNPEGSDTRYYFQYGTAECVSEPAACTDVPAAPGIDLGAGFGERAVSTTLAGLLPSTTYHYRLLAGNGLGSAEGSQTMGTFDTLPSSAGLLADGRAWELVSPPKRTDRASNRSERRRPAPGLPGRERDHIRQRPGRLRPRRQPRPRTDPGSISARSESGWSSQDVMTPHKEGEGLEAGEPAEFRFFSNDLALSLVEPPGGNVQASEEPPLALGRAKRRCMCGPTRRSFRNPPRRRALEKRKRTAASSRRALTRC